MTCQNNATNCLRGPSASQVTPLENETPGEIFDLFAFLEGMACRPATLRMAKPEMQRFGQEKQAEWLVATARQ